MVGHFAARMVIPTRSPNLTQRARRPQSQNLMPENNMQTFPLPLCQGIRGFSVTKQKALAKAAVFALMKRSAIG